ncbi:calcium-activated chloride channel regulator 1-like [Glandiceps talaboti]
MGFKNSVKISTVFFLWTTYFLASDVEGNSNPINIIDNGYETVLVAIHEAIPEDPLLIERIKDIFTSASYHLHQATLHRAFYREVTILIPRTWSDDLTEAVATTERFDIANVIVDQPNPEYGDSPYTRQIRGCGEPGEFIHFTERWVKDEEYSTLYWGDSGKVVVHEWAHLRWGVFDEYPVDDHEYFYYDENGHVQPTRCSESVTGESLNIHNGYKKCNTNPESGVMPEPGCRFFPASNSDVSASYMYANYLDSVTTFCHSRSDGDPKTKHNRLAINKQNNECSYQSAWDVMLNHDDFVEGANPPREELDTTPSFRVVQEVDLRVVLVLDKSGSMNDHKRLDLLLQASSVYIGYTVPNNTWVGIVQFSSSDCTRNLSDLVQVNNQETRQQLIDKLPKTASGGTCIGCGLLEGIKVLEKGGRSAAGGIIFLVGDGEEKNGPYIEDVIDDLIEKEVIVDTMAQSDEADQGLANLSAQTGGYAYWYSESDVSTAMHDGFTDSITSRVGYRPDTPIQLASYKTKIEKYHVYQSELMIDSTIGRHTVFFIFWDLNRNTPVEAVIRAPDGTVFDKNSEEYQVEHDKNTIAVTIPGLAQAGIWNYTISNPDSVKQTVEIKIESKSVSLTSQPLTLSSTTSSDIITESPPSVVIYADLSQGFNPVTKATVTALIELPDYSVVEMPLLDEGVGADLTKHDGVYSAYFLDFINVHCQTVCRYEVQVVADNKDGTAEIIVMGHTGAMATDYSVIPTKGESVPIGDFRRVTSGESFMVDKNVKIPPKGLDVIRPARISDFRSPASDYDGKTFTLRWTAMGNDLDKGTADHYDLRSSNSFNEILDKFENASNVQNDDLITGTLSSPLPAGTEETVVVFLPNSDAGKTYYFGIRAVDAAGNEGAISNIAQNAIVMTPRDDLANWEIFLILSGIIIAILIIIIVIICTSRYRKAKRKERDLESSYTGFKNEFNERRITTCHH